MSTPNWRGEFAAAIEAAMGKGVLDAGLGVLRPPDRERIRRAVELLHEHRIPWRPVGRGGDPGEGLHLSTERLGGVMDLWRQDLVARIGAGCPLQIAQRCLVGEGLRVPATAVHPERDSLGLLFATGQRGWRSGPNRALRESVLGLTAIDGSARVLKGGGRVVKNVAGYDLVRLHHGAGGAFGVLIDLVVRLEALPEAGIELALPSAAIAVANTLAASRAPARELDPVAQLWLDPGSTSIVGLAPEGALLLQAEAWAESVDEWRGGLPAPGSAISIADLLERLEAAAAWHGRWQVSSKAALQEGAACLERWRQRGFGIWMQVDLLAGGATLYAEDARHPLGEVLGELMAVEGRIHSAAGRPVPDGMHTAVSSAIESRLKLAFDPAGLLPSLPSALECSA